MCPRWLRLDLLYDVFDKVANRKAWDCVRYIKRYRLKPAAMTQSAAILHADRMVRNAQVRINY